MADRTIERPDAGGEVTLWNKAPIDKLQQHVLVEREFMDTEGCPDVGFSMLTRICVIV